METSKNIIRKISSAFALVLVSIILSSGLSAQKSLNSMYLANNTNNFLKKSKEEIEKAFYSSSESFYEQELRLEEWMIYLDKFSHMFDSSEQNVEKYASLINEDVTDFDESELQLEEWMTEYDWNFKSADFFTEEELVMEEWMVNPTSW